MTRSASRNRGREIGGVGQPGSGRRDVAFTGVHGEVDPGIVVVRGATVVEGVRRDVVHDDGFALEGAVPGDLAAQHAGARDGDSIQLCHGEFPSWGSITPTVRRARSGAYDISHFAPGATTLKREGS